MKKHAFTLWLLFAVILAVLFPEAASGEGSGPGWRSGALTKLGVWVIFFLQGLSLPLRELTAGVFPKRIHFFVIGWNFLLFPLVTILLISPFAFVLDPAFRQGFCLLAILPTTISSALTFSTVSGGHTANAIFATVFSNICAVFFFPLVALLYLSIDAELSVNPGPVFATLAQIIFLPLVLGQIFRRIARKWAVIVVARSKKVGPAIILFIVHAAFARSTGKGFLEDLAIADVLLIFMLTGALLLAVSYFVWLSSGVLGLDRPRRITAFFCASQKSLATGLPLATTVFAAVPAAIDPAYALIPLLLYHPMQLVLGGWIVGRLNVKL